MDGTEEIKEIDDILVKARCWDRAWENLQSDDLNYEMFRGALFVLTGHLRHAAPKVDNELIEKAAKYDEICERLRCACIDGQYHQEELDLMEYVVTGKVREQEVDFGEIPHEPWTPQYPGQHHPDCQCNGCYTRMLRKG